MIKLYNDNCFNILPTLENNSIDCIICDPPYNINFEKWDNNFDIFKALEECIRILKPNGNLIIFQGYSNVCEVKQYLDKKLNFQDWIIYDRIKGRGGKKHLVSTREDILWYSKGKNYTFNKIPSTIKKKTGGLGIKMVVNLEHYLMFGLILVLWCHGVKKENYINIQHKNHIY